MRGASVGYSDLLSSQDFRIHNEFRARSIKKVERSEVQGEQPVEEDKETAPKSQGLLESPRQATVILSI